MAIKLSNAFITKLQMTSGDLNIFEDFEGTNLSARATDLTPIVQTFTSVGTTSFTIPTAVTRVEYLVVAGGGGGTDGDGGGGAGGSSANLNGTAPGVGGIGVSSDITGTSITYGVGGNGGYNGGPYNGANGTANRGNGGVGGSSPSANSAGGGTGGSGIVVIKYY